MDLATSSSARVGDFARNSQNQPGPQLPEVPGDSILQRGDQPFDQEWMQQTFERYWERAQHVTRWTNAV